MNEDNTFVPKVIQSKGKTIDEAIFIGMRELGLSIDEVHIVTKQTGSKGIFGLGSKPYIVELTERDPDLIFEETVVKEKVDRQSVAFKKVVKNKIETPEPAAEQTENKAFVQAKTFINKADLTPADKAPADQAPNGEGEDFSSISRVTEQVDYKKYIVGESECPGAEFLIGTIERMGVDADIEYYFDDSSVKFRITSRTRGILIGHRGETLDSLQYLTNLVINRQAEAYRYVLLDTGDYRKKREEALIRLAKKTATRVQSTGRSAALEPMRPYERRVMHATIQNFDGLYTFSKGDEGRRYVVIAVDRDRK